MYRPELWPVPVHRLMCKDVRMYSLLTEDRPIHRKEMKMFLSLLHEVVDRWYSAVGPMNPDIASLHNYHIEMVDDLEDCFRELVEDDTETVFETRLFFASVIDAIKDMLRQFSSVFAGPVELQKFYHSISNRIELTIAIIPEGEHGW